MKRFLTYFFTGAAVLGLFFGASVLAAGAYVIQPGDTLSALASRFGTTVNKLAADNNILNKNLIIAGKTLDVGGEKMLGAAAGYTPITGYESRTTQYITASAATIPVASTKDPSGLQINLANISPSGTVSIFMSLEPGTTREEPIKCTGVTASSWTGCTRGLPFQGGSETASSTLQKTHNAGSKIIITNVGQFYNQYVNVDGAQTIYGNKTFTAFPHTSSTTALPTTNDQFVTKYYADTVVSTGFTSANIDATTGLKAAGTSPEKVQFNASSTGGLALDSSNRVYFSGVVNTSTIFNATEAHNGTVAFNSGVYVNTPPTGAGTGFAANDIYVQRQIAFGEATSTAQVAVTAGKAIWMSATSSQVMITNTSVASSTFQFIGIAASTVTVGQQITYTKPGGINCNQSSLTPGLQYYLNGTAGQISTTPGTYFARIGVATSATCLQVMQPKYIETGIQSVSSAITYPQHTDFYPARIEIMSGSDSFYGCLSIGDDTNRSISQGYDGTSFSNTKVDASYAFQCFGGSSAFARGTVTSKSPYGFVLSSDHAGTALTVYWTAFSE